VDPERFQGDTDPYPGHWLESPAPWPFVEAADPVVLAVATAGLALLPDVWARAVRGHDVERRPETEVAAELGVTVAQLRDLLNRGRAEVRERLSRALGDAEDPR